VERYVTSSPKGKVGKWRRRKKEERSREGESACEGEESNESKICEEKEEVTNLKKSCTDE